jgi:dTDP-4-dehydrorhamnose reductase
VFFVKALVVGGGGQLGRKLVERCPPGVQVISLDRGQLDITDATRLSEAIAERSPDCLLNAAAYTAVDQAEREPERAYAVNSAAVASLAAACRQQNVRLVHLSTDFVFDGARSVPYRPSDVPNPLGVYSASKLAGERHVQAEPGLSWRIVRTAWVYASTGRNFMLTMLRLFADRPEVRVVADQIGTPTSAHSLADCVWRAAQDDGASAILHFTDAGVASWYDFAVAIYEEARALGIVRRNIEIVPIGTDQYPTAARRPAYSVLEKRDTVERLELRPVHWRERLRETLKELQELRA